MLFIRINYNINNKQFMEKRNSNAIRITIKINLLTSSNYSKFKKLEFINKILKKQHLI